MDSKTLFGLLQGILINLTRHCMDDIPRGGNDPLCPAGYLSITPHGKLDVETINYEMKEWKNRPWKEAIKAWNRDLESLKKLVK